MYKVIVSILDMIFSKECEAKGEDYDRVKMLNISASDAEKWDRAKQRKKNPDEGFSGRLCLDM